MDLNLNDWLGDHPWAWWLSFVVLLIGAEVVHRGRIAFALAVGATVAAAVAWFAPARGLAQALIAVGVALGAMLLSARRTGPSGTVRNSG